MLNIKTRNKFLASMSLAMLVMLFHLLVVPTMVYAAMTLYIEIDNGETFAINAEPTDRTEDVKVLIANKLDGCDTSSLVLTYNGTILEDGNTLQDYSVQTDATINCSIAADEAGSSSARVIQIGTSAIANPTDDGDNYSYTKIYYGTWSETEGDEEPVLWRVLGDWNGTTDRSSTKLLLSEYVIATASSEYGTNNTWSGSYVQTWCQDFAGITTAGTSVPDAFSAKEFAAIAVTSKSSGSSTVNYVDYTDAALSNEYVFLLSASEVGDDNNTYFSSGTDRATTGTVSNWWLRSSFGDIGRYAGVVDGGGYVLYFSVYNDDIGIRPAFNLDLSAVLFTSAATGGKSSASEGGANALTAIADASEVDGFDDTWKLTLRDAERGFSITGIEEGETVQACLGSTITLTYTGATEYKESSTKDYISVILMDADEENALYYGRVATLSAESGTVDITLPTDLTVNTSYVLCVFSEEYNGDTYTDYASEFSEVTLYIGDHTYNSNGVCTVCGASKDATTTTTTSAPTAVTRASTTSSDTTADTSTSATDTTSGTTASTSTAAAESTTTSPKTADASPIAYMWLLAMASMLAAAACISRRHGIH